MLLRTSTKEVQRCTARQLLHQYLGDDVQTDVLITNIINTIQTHHAQAGERVPRARLVESPTHSRRIYEIVILGKLFRVTYDNKHKELEDLYPLEGAPSARVY